MKRINDPEILEKCLQLLSTLKLTIQENGFDPENDKKTLTKLYGRRSNEPDSDNDLFKTYETVPTISDMQGLAQAKEYFLNELNNEVQRLIRNHEKQRLVEANHMKLESLRRSIPESPRLDQLLRYSASLERSFDRTLNQLERAQRMRLGQPVPPAINVKVSSS